ncbi:MAG: aldo/keto reductase [candidate division Zixibacteria bacterium]|nr:aldo/keto reductase [candidate division Zixibacteria bacterium]
MNEKNSDCTRRRFLTTAASGLVSAGLAGLAPGISFAQEAKAVADDRKKEIIYRQLGKEGMKVPIVSMGAMNSSNPGIIQASYELGVRHFDTAANYQYGRNEQMVGNVLKKMGVRDKANIGTKVYIPEQRVDDPKAARKKIVELCEGSLKRLKTDYVDILYIHSVSDPADVDDPGIRDAFADLKEQKKIRHSGLATHGRMAEVINEATRVGFYDIILTSFNFTMADDAAMMGALDNAAKNGISIIAMKTQAGGQRLPNPESLRNYSSSTIATAALKWVMRNENIATSIPGYDNFEHMKEDFSVASDLEFTPDEKKFLSDNDVKLSMGFCRQCEQCLVSCPNNADIPTLMRTHMYAAQYANFHHARMTLDEIPKQAGLLACKSCNSCLAQCVHSVDIARRIDELKLMYA